MALHGFPTRMIKLLRIKITVMIKLLALFVPKIGILSNHFFGTIFQRGQGAVVLTCELQLPKKKKKFLKLKPQRWQTDECVFLTSGQTLSATLLQWAVPVKGLSFFWLSLFFPSNNRSRICPFKNKCYS